jgi:hypothetical protein
VSLNTDYGSGAATPTDSRYERDNRIAATHFGSKTITFFGSIVLTINNASGPGMLVLPRVFQQGGWLPCSLLLVAMCFVSGFSATFLCDSIARVPGNHALEQRVEFGTVFHAFFGPATARLAQLAFVLSVMSQCLASIIQVAQVMDGILVATLSKTYALDPSYGVIEWTVETNCSPPPPSNHHCVPFGERESYVPILTLGYVILLVLIMPIGLMRLNENIAVQIVSFAMLVSLTLYFIVMFCVDGLHPHAVPMIGPQLSDVGSIIFNMAFVVFIPSWLNEKQPEVSVNASMWVSTVAATAGYVVMGVLGGMAFPCASSNILALLLSPASSTLMRAAASLLGMGVIGLGIPVFCIMMRYNLIAARLCSPRWAVFYGVFAPWMVAWTMYCGTGAQEVIAWMGTTVNGVVNFIFPLVLALRASGVVFNSICSGALPNMHDIVLQCMQTTHTDATDALAFGTNRVHLVSSTVLPLPASLFKYQRRIIFGLLVVTILLVVLGLSNAIIAAVDPATLLCRLDRAGAEVWVKSGL